MVRDNGKEALVSRGRACGNDWRSLRDDFVEITPRVCLHVRDWGCGKSIVFVHGWPLCNEMFEYQFTRLTQDGFRCVAPSLRGFGKSSQPWGDCNVDILADDLLAILEACGLQDVVLAGFGMGGAVALRYMARHGGYRVSKLAFLAAAAPVWAKRSDFAAEGPHQAEIENLIALCTADRARLIAEMIRRFFRHDSASSACLADWLFHLGMQASPIATAAALRMLGEIDLRADVTAVKVATLIMHGRHDLMVPFDTGRALADAILRSHFVAFDGSGHALFWEERERFNAELARFAA